MPCVREKKVRKRRSAAISHCLPERSVRIIDDQHTGQQLTIKEKKKIVLNISLFCEQEHNNRKFNYHAPKFSLAIAIRARHSPP